MLQMSHIRKIYRTELVETHALRELSVSVASGEFVAVTGSSGSGKTTFPILRVYSKPLTMGLTCWTVKMSPV